MGKRLLLSFTLLLVAFTLFGASLADKSSWVPTGLSLGTGNDKWAFGISRNNDDQLSYSVNFQLDAPVWFLSIDMNGYTNRGWKDAWYTMMEDGSTDNFYNGRYDVLDVTWGLKWLVGKSRHFAFSAVPKLGMQVAGNLGFVEAQNLLHKIARIHQVSLPYEDGMFFAPKLALELRIDNYYTVSELQSILGFALVGNVEQNFTFEGTEYIGGEVYLHREDTRLLSLGYGYEWYQGYSGWKTQKLANWFMAGPKLSFNVDAGALHFSYFHSFSSTFGYTTYYVDVMDFFHPSTWKENDMFISVGLSLYLDGSYRLLQIENPIGNSGWSILVDNRYVAGDPTFKDIELNADPSKVSRMKKGFSSWSIGAKYSFPNGWSRGWVTPFVDLTMGFEHWELSELKNMKPDSALPWSVESEYAFVMDLEGGLAIMPKGWLKSKNASYRLLVGGGLMWVPQAASITHLLKRSPLFGVYPSEEPAPPYLIPRFSVALQIGFDL